MKETGSLFETREQEPAKMDPAERERRDRYLLEDEQAHQRYLESISQERIAKLRKLAAIINKELELDRVMKKEVLERRMVQPSGEIITRKIPW